MNAVVVSPGFDVASRSIVSDFVISCRLGDVKSGHMALNRVSRETLRVTTNRCRYLQGPGHTWGWVIEEQYGTRSHTSLAAEFLHF